MKEKSVRRGLKEDVLYLMVVNMPTEAEVEVAKIVAGVEREKGGKGGIGSPSSSAGAGVGCNCWMCCTPYVLWRTVAVRHSKQTGDIRHTPPACG